MHVALISMKFTPSPPRPPCLLQVYVFDTQSEPPMEPVLSDMIESGLVTYELVTNATKGLNIKPAAPGRGINWQTPIIERCLRLYGHRHRWIGGQAGSRHEQPQTASKSTQACVESARLNRLQLCLPFLP